MQVIKGSFEELEFFQWKESVLGFGADGASVNLGSRQGVAAKLKQGVSHCLHTLPTPSPGTVNA